MPLFKSNMLKLGTGLGGALLAHVYLRHYLGSSTLLLTMLASLYFPFYCDGSEYSHGIRYWDALSNYARPKILSLFVSNGLAPKVVLKNPNSFKDTKQVIFGSHPHGVMSFHHALLYLNVDGAEELIKSIPLHMRRALGARSLFGIPIFRDLVLMAGAVDASAPVASKCLSKGYSLTILPGGEQEQLLAERNVHMIYIRSRKGFCKLAVKHGVPLVPAYCFGETSTFHTSHFLLNQRKWLAKKFFIAIPFAWGSSSWNPFSPLKVPFTHCIGEPIHPPAVDPTLDPDADFRRRVDLLHGMYIEALSGLFDDNKTSCGLPDAQLIII